MHRSFTLGSESRGPLHRSSSFWHVSAPFSVEEQPRLCILHDPAQALLQVFSRDRTTPENVPSMRPDVFEP